MEGLLSELDYFEPQVMQMSINGEYDRTFGIGQTIVQGGPIEFFIRGADGLYLDLNNSKLELKIKITNDDGSNLGANAHVGPINNLLNTFFLSVEMELGGVLITDPNTKYSFRSIIENLINYDKNVMDTRMLAEGWLKDTAGQMNVTDPTGNNLGLRDRACPFEGSHVVTVIGRPHLDLFHQEKLIPANVDVKLKFFPNSSRFILCSPAANPQINYKVHLVSARMFIRTKEISPSLILAQEKLLQEHNYSIPYNKITTKTITIPNGTSQIEFDNVYQGKLPDLVVLAMVSDSNMNGGYQNNPFNFENFGANYICLLANGLQIPRSAYQPNFDEDDYIRAYYSVLEALGFDVGPHCLSICPFEWAHGYNIYAFKVTPGPIGSVRSPSCVGSIRLEIKFSAGTTHNINVILLSQQSAEIQIDKYKNVIMIA